MSVARRPDEEALWAAVLAGETPAAARGPLGIRYGRCIYLCEKWKARGIYDYATEPDVGRIERWTWVAVLCSTQEWLSETQESHDARIEHAIGEAAAEADRLHVTGITATLHLEAMGWYDPAIDDGMPSVTAIRFEGTPTLDTQLPL